MVLPTRSALHSVAQVITCALSIPNPSTIDVHSPYLHGAQQMPGQQLAQRPKGQQGGGGGGGRKRSFLVGTQDVLEGGDYDQTFTNTSGGALPPWTLQGTGWLARLWFYVTYTTTGGSALTADAPYILFNTVQLNDVNNEAIFGPFH